MDDRARHMVGGAHSDATSATGTRMLAQRLMWIAWPAFLMAGVLEVLVFAMVDPADVTWFGEPLQWSRTAVYSVAFFAFWLLMICSSALTVLLEQSPQAVNRVPGAGERSPDAGPGASRDSGRGDRSR